MRSASAGVNPERCGGLLPGPQSAGEIAIPDAA
jgi:hypothetical protein